jgi:hypothetical protein
MDLICNLREDSRDSSKVEGSIPKGENRGFNTSEA